MLKEALQHLQDTFRAGQQVEITKIPGDGDQRMLLRKPDGSTEVITPTPGPRVIHCETFSDFAARIGESWSRGMNPALCFGFGWAAYLPDHYDPAERMTWFAPPSHEHDILNELRQASDDRGELGWRLSVHQAYALFRWELYDALPEKRRDEFINAVSELKVIAENQQRAKREGGVMTGGIESTHRVSNSGGLPLCVDLKVMPYASAEFSQRIPLTLRLEPDAETSQWQLYLPQANWTRYVHEATEHIGEQVRQHAPDEAPVFSGKVVCRRGRAAAGGPQELDAF